MIQCKKGRLFIPGWGPCPLHEQGKVDSASTDMMCSGWCRDDRDPRGEKEP